MALHEIWAQWNALDQTTRTEVLESLTPEDRAVLFAGLKWSPLPGPQTDAYESEADILLYGGAAGGGKALTLSEVLPTPTGWTTIGAVQVGDKIFATNGQACTVTATSPVMMNHQCWAITFDDGTSVVADGEHRWLTFDAKELAALTRRDPEWRAKRRERRASRVNGRKSALFSEKIIARNQASPTPSKPAPTGTVRTTAEIAASVTTPTGRRNHAIPVCQPLEMPPAKLPLDPHLLGLWLGDGAAWHGMVYKPDPEIEQAFQRRGWRTRRYNTLTFGVYGLRTVLRSMGLLRNKHVPAEYLRASREQRLELLRGLMDTDGTVCDSGAPEFTNTNKAIIDAAYELIVSLGWKACVIEGRSRGRFGSATEYTDYGPKWDIKWTPDEYVFHLPRKRKLQKLAERRTTRFRYIVSCTPVPSEPVRCIAVDSADHLYLAGRSLVPTHNTDLLLGVARNEHRRSIIFRRVFPSLRAIIDRSREIYNPVGDTALKDRYNEALSRWKFHDGRQVRFGSIQYESNVTDWQGQAFDFFGFDELPELTEYQFRYVTGWNRTTYPNQRCRIICTGNPPTTADGEWVLEFWAPWLKENYPNPAKPGEIRWFTTRNGKDIEVESGAPVKIDGELVYPRSRTFIPARVQDNPFLMRSGYVAQLQSLPEPLRSKMLYGDFRAGREDDAYQVIPSAWVAMAMERWKARPKPTTPMTQLGVDPARGGQDKTVLAPRWDNYLGELVVEPGKATPDGPAVATLVAKVRRDDARVCVDVIGVGASVYDTLKETMREKVVAMNAAEKSIARDQSKKLGFVNKRAEWYWRMREALAPNSGQEIALPPDPELKSDLCAPTWKLTARGIQVEPKEDIIDRIKRSPDKGDATVYAFAQTGAGNLEFLRAMTARG